MKRSSKFALIVIGSGLIFCLTVLVYATFISSNPSDILKKYQFGSLAGMAFFCLAFTFREETKINFALVIISIGVTVYLVEISLFFGWGVWYQNTVLLPQKNPLFAQTKYEVIMGLREQGVDAYSSIHPVLFIESNGLLAGEDLIYPLAGLSNKRTVDCNESGEWFVFDSDDHGFNNPPKSYGKPDVDIALIGDSFTYGSCVKPGEEIAALLRNGGKTVLNLGYSGNGPLIELATLKEYAEPFKPRIVLWLYYEENDLSGLLKDKESPLLLNYLDKDFSQGLLNRQTEIDSMLMKYIKAKEAKKLEEAKEVKETKRAQDSMFISDWGCFVRVCNMRRLLKFDALDLPQALPEDSPQALSDNSLALPLFREVLIEAKARSNAWGGKFYFVYLPAWNRYAEHLNQDNLHHRREVLSLVQELSIPIIDFHEIISAHPDSLSLFPFRRYGHYNAEGYRLVAEQIETYLMSDSGE